MTSYCKELLKADATPVIHPKIWTGLAPFKVKVFSWIAGLQKILTINNLRYEGCLSLNSCPLCLSDVESVNHLLLHCPTSYQIWVHFFQLLGIKLCLPRQWSDLFNEEVVMYGSSFRRTLWATTVQR